MASVLGMVRTNRDVYETAGAVQEAASYRPKGLLKDEEAILDRFAPFLADAALLDVGVGAGRTTGPLLKLVRDYVGVDLSSAMVRECQQAFPGTRFLQQDACDLKDFTTASFDAVLFCYNGIDSVGHADRLRILSEVRRVLRPGGLFIFSSHNLDWTRARARRLVPPRDPGNSPRQLAGHAVRTVRTVANFLRNRSRQIRTAEYEIINDPAHFHSLMHYYISAPQMATQLRDNGFTDVVAYDHDGVPIDSSTDIPWITYSARSIA